jgi:hypothetical protein
MIYIFLNTFLKVANLLFVISSSTKETPSVNIFKVSLKTKLLWYFKSLLLLKLIVLINSQISRTINPNLT